MKCVGGLVSTGTVYIVCRGGCGGDGDCAGGVGSCGGSDTVH